MSQRNREGKRTARERLHEQRAHEKTKAKRARALKAGGVIVVVLAAVGLVGVVAADQRGEKTSTAEPVALGKARAPSTLTIYEDFRCPACAHFERTYADTIQELQEKGQLRTEYHLVTIIDGNMGGKGSRNAANAALCARDQEKFTEYHDVLFAHQPAEDNDAFGNKRELIRLAKQVDGLDSASFRKCVRAGSHDDWVQRSDAAFANSEHNATPTVLLDGENLYTADQQLTPEVLKRKVEKAAKAS